LEVINLSMSTSYPSFNTSDPMASPAQKETAVNEFIEPTLSIICVNWNSVDYLIDCIASINERTNGLSFEVIVVDNDSPDGGLERVSDRFPLVRIVKSERNLGFAGANNVGFRHSNGQYILLLNPDTKLVNSAINIMIEKIKSIPDAGIVGCMLLNEDLSISTTSIQKFPTILNQLLSVEFLRLRYPNCPLWEIGPLFEKVKNVVKVDVIPGACMMLKRDVFERAGLLSECYFMYAEDIDLNFKVKQIGYSSYFVGDAQIVHFGGKSSSRQRVSQWSTVMTYEAMVQFFLRSRGYWYGYTYRVVMGLAAAFRLLLLAMIFPFGNRQSIQWSAEKWSTILKWSIGVEQLGVGR
jgi:GT2 family glycosyltransferase